MVLSVITPASERYLDLTTREAVKSRLRITDSERDEVIDQLISEASDAVRRYCKREFVRERVEESGLSIEDGYLMVSRTPVVEVHSANRSGEPVLEGWEIVDAEAGLLAMEDSYLHAGESRWWSDTFAPGRRERYTLEYTGGFVTPQMAASRDDLKRDLPYDLEGAVISFVGSALVGGDPGGAEQRIKSIKVEDITYQYADASAPTSALGFSATDALERWKRVI